MTANAPAEDLAYIRRLMEQTHVATVAQGHYFVAWGVLVGLALIGTWLLVRGVIDTPWYAIWAPAIALGWIYVAWAVRRQMRVQRACSTLGRLIGFGWMACGIAMTLTFFVAAPLGAISVTAIPGLVGAFMGIGVLLTGLVAGIGWLVLVAVGWWLGAVLMWMFQGSDALAILTACVVLLQIVPGLLLTARSRRLQKAAAA
jgi:hypothetical protein